MEREILLNLIKFRLPFRKTIVGPIRSYSSLPKKVGKNNLKNYEEKSGSLTRPSYFAGSEVPHWNEYFAARKLRKSQKFPYTIKDISSLFRFFQSWKNFPVTPLQLLYYFRRRWVRNQVAEQVYVPRRVEVLKPDLAAAHFLLRRGGHIKLLGSDQWVGHSGSVKKIPLSYVPGTFVEAIKAEGTHLFPEGLANLDKLRYLSYLSLRNLETMNDWCMDHISKEHYLNLKHLDISGCKNITYRGLSCFYRFECLKTLNVEGIPDPPEFKLACLMLLDIIPDLEIQGIDLTIPRKIDPVGTQQMLNKADSELTAV